MTYQAAYHWDTVFCEEFERESDRACAILAVAVLDQTLEALIKSYLVPISSTKDDLLDGAYAPMSTFSARIDFAHRIGLISTRLCRDLHIVRRIRNDFAHNISGCTFENETVRNRVNELQRSLRLSQREPETRKKFLKGIKGDFQMAVSWMIFHLWARVDKIDSIEPYPLEPPYWTTEKLKKAKTEFAKQQKQDDI